MADNSRPITQDFHWKPFDSASRNRPSSGQRFTGHGKNKYPKKASRLKKMTYKELQKLREQDSATIALTLSREECCFEEILKESGSDFESVTLLASLVAKVCSSRTSIQNTLKILVYVQSSSFLTANISTQLAKVPTDPTVEMERLTSFLGDTILMLQELSKRMPHVFAMTLGVIVLLEGTVAQMKEKLGSHYDALALALLQLNKMKAGVLEQVTKESQRAQLPSHQVEPPDDFREISVLPKRVDLVPDTKPFLRKNRKVGAYNSVDDYLDTQFRLLREDFIQPLREGIEEYINSKKNPGGKSTIRAYNQVRFIRLVCSEDGILYRIRFNLKPFEHVDWGNTKRLNYGSLICLSQDGFNTFCFATVVKNDEVQHGVIDIAFDEKLNVTEFPYDKDMVMVETPAYFEAYRHVLKGLQNMKNDMPFTKYIVDCETEVHPPDYLNQNNGVFYDLSSLKQRAISYVPDDVPREGLPSEDFKKETTKDALMLMAADRMNCRNVPVLDNSGWPDAEDIAMNQSQFRAFQTALSKEFAIIQGPPGTGKTYTGLKIAKALLTNRPNWTSDTHPSPILIVCYTNHALDQFLEGIMNMLQGTLVRVGSRSKSGILEQYNLKKLKNDLLYNQRNLGDEMKDSGLIELRESHKRTFLGWKDELEALGRLIDAVEYGILHEKHLKPFMKKHFHGLLKGLPYRRIRSAILVWLGFWGIGRKHQITNTLDLSNHDQLMNFLRTTKGNLISYRRSLLVLDLADFQMNDEEWLKIHKLKVTRKKKNAFEATVQQELASDQKMTNAEADRVMNIWRLSMTQRWRLYRLWIYEFISHMRSKMEPMRTRCNETAAMYKEATAQIDKHILSNATVIGMTTTGAARYQSVLAEIQPPIIIIEEAAEVLEGHVVTSLSPGCKHLILIGDHQQLRPSANVYELAKKYNLDLSLFERMINNGFPYDCLELQHRMRPSISRLLRNIYPDLKDHDSVLLHDNVLGITDNVFFINHTVLEAQNQETMSHMNEFEADYLTALCRYLFKQGYPESCITILSFYSAQVTCLRKRLKEEIEDGLLITAVDNYQGEENDIILLSLVRSNVEGKIGFLNNENRICVALSRARIGLYAIGNFQLLSEKSTMWRNIISDLESKKCIGPGLKIFCQNHLGDHGIVVEKPEDFMKAPEGGCIKPCQYRLQCGHVCDLACHPYDQQHLKYLCRKPCTKILCHLGHNCPLECHESCDECKFPVEKKVPTCGHIQSIPCYLPPEEFKCEEACTKHLACGHECGEKCGYDHKCHEHVPKSWKCGHNANVACETKRIAECPAACHTVLACKHKCSRSCQECNGGRLHMPCIQPCGKSLPCGHECRSLCSICPPCSFACENACAHTVCNKKCGEPCTPCKEMCVWSCAHYKCTKQCSEECDRPRCDEPCNEDLPCGHKCIGLCGEPCPPYCRVCQKEELTEVMSEAEVNAEARFIHLIECGHIVEVGALDKYMMGTMTSGVTELKRCPMCDTPIRWNMRYGNIIKRVLDSIEAGKEGQAEVDKRIDKRSSLFRAELRGLNPEHRIELQRHLDIQNIKSEQSLEALLMQVQLLKSINKLKMNWNNASTFYGSKYQTDRDILERDIRTYKTWLTYKRITFSVQETKDAEMEETRLRFSAFLLDHLFLIEKQKITLPSDLKLRLEEARSVVTDRFQMTHEKKAMAESLRREVEDHLPESGLGISEKKSLVVDEKGLSDIAMGDAKERCYMCKNGHVSVMVHGTAFRGAECPDCGGELFKGDCRGPRGDKPSEGGDEPKISCD